jgi:hypothetical protein
MASEQDEKSDDEEMQIPNNNKPGRKTKQEVLSQIFEFTITGADWTKGKLIAHGQTIKTWLDPLCKDWMMQGEQTTTTTMQWHGFFHTKERKRPGALGRSLQKTIADSVVECQATKDRQPLVQYKMKKRDRICPLMVKDHTKLGAERINAEMEKELKEAPIKLMPWQKKLEDYFINGTGDVILWCVNTRGEVLNGRFCEWMKAHHQQLYVYDETACMNLLTRVQDDMAKTGYPKYIVINLTKPSRPDEQLEDALCYKIWKVFRGDYRLGEAHVLFKQPNILVLSENEPLIDLDEDFWMVFDTKQHEADDQQAKREEMPPLPDDFELLR